MKICFGICGTAGRKDDEKRLSRKHFDAMCLVASGLIDQCEKNNYKITTLISGGAAYADFVAVKLFLDKKVPNLKVYLPSKWECGRFYDSGIRDSFKNPGGTANYYHKKFQTKTGINSLSQMQIAMHEGAEFIPVEKGFYARNYLVAKESDFLLAITFGNERELKPGGSAHCMKCYLDRVRKEGIFDKSFHYDLNSGKVFIGATVSKEEDTIKVPPVPQSVFQPWKASRPSFP